MSEAVSVWEAVTMAGESSNLVPIGFGARDTLRLEAGMLLYGQDMDDSTSAVEAGIPWAVDFDKLDFVGRERNVREKSAGSGRNLIGFEMTERGIPRHGFGVEKAGRTIGQVTSGTFAPTLKKNIGLAYVSREESALGNEIDIVIRNQKVKAKIVKTPFYKRSQAPL
jgi:aminomethyltransferase